MPDVAIIDGDHNYWTVSEELRLIGERAPGSELPLLLFHDVCWPHARRDDYFAPELIPEDYRQPIAGNGNGKGIFPGEPGLTEGGVPYPKSAAREGGPRNGVLTAVEDFVGGREGLRLVVVPQFFGLGVVWHTDAPWSDALGEILDPWDRNPVLERLEGNRVFHLAQAMRDRWKSGVCRSASAVRRRCFGACSSRARSRWPSASRGCGYGRASASRPRSCRRPRSVGPWATRICCGARRPERASGSAGAAVR